MTSIDMVAVFTKHSSTFCFSTFAMSAAQSDTMSTTEVAQVCANCNNTEGELKKCARCKMVLYCNRECQTAHWKEHKRQCSRLAGERAPPSAQSGSGSSSSSAANPFARLSNNTFLHDRPEEETFRILVDVLRMRQEDKYKFEGDTMPGTIYDGESSSEMAFRDMLRRAKQVRGLLPPWWSSEKEEECIRNNEAALQSARKKSDIQESWQDNMMPMKLRMVGETIYGYTPGSVNDGGQAMRRMQQVMGAGDLGMKSKLFDLSKMTKGSR